MIMKTTCILVIVLSGFLFGTSAIAKETEKPDMSIKQIITALTGTDESAADVAIKEAARQGGNTLRRLVEAADKYGAGYSRNVARVARLISEAERRKVTQLISSSAKKPDTASGASRPLANAWRGGWDIWDMEIHEKTRNDIVEALGSKSDGAREAARRALEQVRATDVLVALLDNSNSTAVSEAVKALKVIGSGANSELLEVIEEGPESAAKRATGIRSDIADGVFERFVEADDVNRGLVSDIAAFWDIIGEHIKKQLGSDDEQMRKKAVAVITSRYARGVDKGEIAMGLIESTSEAQGKSAVEILETYGSSFPDEFRVAMMKTRDRDIPRKLSELADTQEAFNERGAKRGEEVYAALADEVAAGASEPMRMRARRGRINTVNEVGPAAIEALMQRLVNDDPEVAKSAMLSLRLAGADGARIMVKVAGGKDTLAKMVRETLSRMHVDALDVLAELDAPWAKQVQAGYGAALARRIEWPEPLREDREKVLLMLRAGLEAPKATDRYEAALALTHAGDGAGLDKVAEAIEDEELPEHIRWRAAWVLGFLGDFWGSNAPGKDVRERGRQIALKAIDDETRSVRREAVRSLALIGQPEDAETLKPLLSAKDDSVMYSAGWAMGKLTGKEVGADAKAWEAYFKSLKEKEDEESDG
ncbi:MAG: HEAT repeat domain-containing protein [Planctomycetota bacterium]